MTAWLLVIPLACLFASHVRVRRSREVRPRYVPVAHVRAIALPFDWAKGDG